MVNDPFADHYDAVHKYVSRRFAKSAADADDITQAVYVKTYAYVRRHGEPDSPLLLLKTVARTIAIDHYRSASRRNRIESAVARPDLLDDGTLEPVSYVCEHEDRDRVFHQLRRLSPIDRSLVTGFYYNGQSDAELSRRWYSTPGSIKARLYKARQKLRTLVITGGTRAKRKA